MRNINFLWFRVANFEIGHNTDSAYRYLYLDMQKKSSVRAFKDPDALMMERGNPESSQIGLKKRGHC